MSQNKNIIMVMGRPNTGKSCSLMNLKNQERMVYLNCDLKELPFRDKFAVNVEISNATDIIEYIQQIEENPDIDGAVLDTLTFLMQMYERQYVVPLAGTKQGQSAWADYGNFYRDVVHAIKSGTKDYIVLAHEEVVLNETTMQMESRVPVKGAVGKVGVEADFTTILSAKNVPTKKLEQYKNSLLSITPDEEEDGSKRVFMTRTNKETAGEKMRSPMGLWSRDELYIDNDLNQVLARIKKYYAG